MGMALGLLVTTLGLGLAAAGVYFYTHFVPTNELQVKTTHGWVEGGYTTTRSGRKIVQFLGIPYAKPPVKNLSFKPPVEHDMWAGVRNATVECPVCVQQFVLVEELRDKVIGEEDCLCVNIFTPSTPTKKAPGKLPVIFFIHGGGYMGMSTAKAYYGPEMLLDKNVVLVTASYRLGVLGFLTTEDNVIPGNWAMKDQALALRWVKANIDKFGGDPDSITLMGEDTGAGSVHLHMLSPLTKDLFHRGIIESGSGLCMWGFSEPNVLKERSRNVAELLGCPFEPSEKFLECLQKIDSRTIVNTTKEFLIFDEDPFAFWNPVVESADVKDAFLVKNPYELTSDKPLLAGFNYAEGMMKISSLISGDASQIDERFINWRRQFYRITPISLLYALKVADPETLSKLTRRIRDFYIKPKEKRAAYYSISLSEYVLEGAFWPYLKTRYIPQLNKMFGDFWFTNGVLDAVEKHSGPKYLYHFNYNTTESVCTKMYSTDFYGGACHMDELMYLFPMNITVNNFMSPQSADYNLSLKMVDLWTNFATNSVPTATDVTWNPVKTPALEHLEITKDGFTMKTNPISGRREFWKSLKIETL